MRRSWWRAVVGTCLVVGVLTPITAPAAGARAVTASLDIGSAAFWQGTWASSGDVPSPSLCGTPLGDCWTYTVVTTHPAWRLRIALDHPVRSDPGGEGGHQPNEAYQRRIDAEIARESSTDSGDFLSFPDP